MVTLKQALNNKNFENELNAINIKTKTFHLETKKCRHIQNMEPKYIQGTKAFEDEVIEKGFRLCKDCTNYHY